MIFGFLLLLPVLAAPAAAQTAQVPGEASKPAPATIEAGDAATEATAPPRPLGLVAIPARTASASSLQPQAISLDRNGGAGGHP